MSSISCTTPREKLTAMFATLNVRNPADSAGHAISVMPTLVQGIDLFEQMFGALGATFPESIHDALCKAGIQYDDALYQADPAAISLARELIETAYTRTERALDEAAAANAVARQMFNTGS